MRASDADRDRVASALREHYAEGRLADTELAERIDRAYASRTVGELRELTLDLPEVTPTASPAAPAPAVPPARAGRPARDGRALRAMWTTWAVVVAINVAVWLLVSISSGDLTYFWPMWVAGPWGAVLAVTTVARRFGGSD